MKKTFLSIALMFCFVLASKAQTKIPAEIEKLLQKNTCLACHKVDVKLVGPAYKEVMKKYKYKAAQIEALIAKPDPKHWAGYPPMAPQPQVPKEEASKIAHWIASLK